MREKGRRFEEASLVLAVAKALRLAKQRFTYRELSAATGVQAPLLSRYVTGRSLPSPETAARILEGLERLADPRRALAERMAETGGLVDTTVVLTDPLYLLLATLHFARRHRGRRVTRILVPEASGIPLATMLAEELETPLTLARRAPAAGGGGGLCSRTPPVFCVEPKSIGRSDRVLVVDDIVETGATLRALREIIEAAGATLAGVAALVAVGEEWREVSGVGEVDALITIRKRAGRLPSI
ncbi:MAG: helix-turn-helix domain-containing protein [Crenarchaeota archaeon]|nr:helix-turn-helix domain-containing protein [Thermoproteota archaeon]